MAVAGARQRSPLMICPTNAAAVRCWPTSPSPSVRRTASGSSGPTAWASRRCCSCWPASSRPTRAHRPRPAHRHRGLSGPGTRSTGGRDGHGGLGPPHRLPGRRGRAGPGGGGARRGTRAAEERYEVALERFDCCRGGRSGGPHRTGPDELGLGPTWPIGRSRRCRAARGPGWPWPPSSSPASTSPCSTSPPTTSTSTASTAWRLGGGSQGRHGRRLPRPRLPRAHGDERAGARPPLAIRPPVRGRVDGLPGRASPRRSACRRGLRAVRVPARRSWPIGPSASASGLPPGVRRESQATPGQRQGPARLPDQPHREAGVQGPPDRAGHRGAGRGGEAVGGVGPPLRHRSGAAGRSGGGPSRAGPSSSEAPSGWDRSTSRSAGRTGWR